MKTSDERARAVHIIDQETRRLIGLVENVLQLSRQSNGGNALPCRPMELAGVTLETVRAFRPLADEDSIDIQVVVEDTPTVMADPNAVRQVVLNLLDNAVKYGPFGQHIVVKVFREDGNGCLAVQDQGPGVPLAERERVWESFYRLEREELAANAGSGIGLTIVRQLVHEMGGSAKSG